MAQNSEGLEVEIDLALYELWVDLTKAFEEGILREKDRELIATYLRQAYGRGYLDGLAEEDIDLATRNGYATPKKGK